MIWTQITKSICYDDNSYAKQTSYTSKSADHSQELPECSLFNSYYTEV